jgi:hypothetical protein
MSDPLYARDYVPAAKIAGEARFDKLSTTVHLNVITL